MVHKSDTQIIPMFLSIKKKLQRENSIASNDTSTFRSGKINRPALPLGVTQQEIQQMTSDQVECLFEVFLGETDDTIGQEKIATFKSLSLEKKRLMLQAHYQRTESAQLSSSYSLDPHLKALSTGKFALKALSSLRVLLSSGPIG